METEEKIIFSIQIDQSDSVNKIANLTKEIDSLKQANKQLAASEGDNTKAITENNLLIKQATDERGRQSKAVLASMEAIGKEAKSIDDARSAVKQLTIERNKLDISTDAGKIKQKQLNNSIDEHNKFIKQNVDQYQQQKINIGNYTSALSGIKGPLGNAIQGLQSMKDGFNAASGGMDKANINMKSLNGIMKANVIGVVILALSGLIAVFSRFEPIIEKVEFIFAGISQAVDVLVSRFIDIGKAIVNLDFKNFGLNLQGVAGEMKNAYKEGYNLAQMFDSIEERQTDGIITQSKYERAVASLNVELKNKTKTQSELIAISDKIAALDKAEIERKLSISDANVKAIARDNVAKIAAQKINEQDRIKFVTAYAEREKIQQEFEVATERRENRVDAINQKFQAKKDATQAKLDADKTKADEKEKQRAEKNQKDNEERAKEYTDLEKKELKKTHDLNAQKVQVNQEHNASLLADEKSLAEERKLILQTEINQKQMAASALMAIGALMVDEAGKQTEAGKALAIISTTISTWVTAQKAYESAFLPVPNVFSPAIGALSAGAAIAVGLANIANISGINAAAGGGDFMTTGPTMLLVGDNPGGRERVTVEPISGRGKTTINPNSGLIAMAGGGTLTTTGYGGYSQRNSKGNGMIDYDMLAKSFSKLPPPRLHITELNKVQSNQQKVLVKASL